MANGMSALFEVEFEDYSSVKTKLNAISNKIKNDSKIKLDVDMVEFDKITQDMGKLSKQQLKIMDDGQVTLVSKFNDELGKTVELRQNLTKNTVSVGIDENFEKQQKEYTKLFDKAEADEKKRIANREKEYAKLFDTIEKEELATINKMADAREKVEVKKQQDLKKSEKLQAEASNKALEQMKKEEQMARDNEKKTSQAIETEREKLKLKQQAIEVSKQGLVNEEKLAQVSEKINNLSGSNVKEVTNASKQLANELTKLDNEAKLNGVTVGDKNLKTINKELSNSKNAIKTADNAIKAYGENVETLGNKQKALVSAVSQSQQKVKLFESAMKENQKTLDRNKTSMDALVKKKAQLNQEYTRAKGLYGAESNELKTLERSINAVDNEYKELESRLKYGQKAMETHSQGLSKAKSELSGFESELVRTNNSITKHSNVLKDVGVRFENLGNKMQTAGSKMSSIGNDLMLLSAPMIAFGG